MDAARCSACRTRPIITATVTFGKPTGGKKGDPRPLQEPGTYWEYNDVRINQLSLALLHLFQRPLPEVFREAIMRPIGASERLELGRLRQRLGGDRRPARAVGPRRHALGRRHVDQQRGPGAGRPADAGRRHGQRQAGAVSRLDAAACARPAPSRPTTVT